MVSASGLSAQLTKPSTTRLHRHDSAGPLLRRLELLKWTFDGTAAGDKVRLLRKLERAVWPRTRDWLTFHDALCVLRTYPDNARVLRAAEHGLSLLARRLEGHLKSAGPARRAAFQDSGLPGSDILHPFSLELCDRLVKRYPGRVEIDWDETEDESVDRLLRLQTLVVTWSENDSLDYDYDLDVWTWLTRAKSRLDRTRLETLLRLFRHSPVPRPVQRLLFDELYLAIRFRLGDLKISRTRHRLPCRRVFFQGGPRVGRSASLRTALSGPAAPLRKLSARKGQYYIEALQDAHAVRNRELFPVIFANPAESYLYEAGRGLQFVLFGMTPDMRLPFETNLGGLLVRNGMPLGYCIAAPWFDRSEIAINVFPAFRSGESAFVFEQFARLLHHHFGIRAFYVRSHQMGEDDPEPLESGAFWFYYKLGFRAVVPRVHALAERERQKISASPGYRSPLATLKRLSHTDVMLHVDPRRQSRYQEPPLVNLAYAITRWFATHANGDRNLGTRKAVSLLTTKLRLYNAGAWSVDEKTALERWAPLLVQIKGLSKWSATDRAHLAAIVRAKGGPSELKFVRLCQSHPRLLAEFRQIARSVKR